ncbi:MAG: histidinol-phosphate transaminase [Halothiobacillaceae bacterium]
MSHTFPADRVLPNVRALTPYVPGKPIDDLARELGLTDIVKLASNENPLGASPAARAALAAADVDLALYPDGSAHSLRSALAARTGCQPEMITLGNGSNDVLELIARAFLGPGREAVFSEHAFAVYPIVTQATGATARVVPALGPDSDMPFGNDLAGMARAIGEHTAVVFLANPNNPTGTWVLEEPLTAFLEQVPSSVLVVLDEAYTEYVTEPGFPDGLALRARFPNLVVTRTFSKIHGLAGLRVGYGVGSPEIADLLNRVRQPFNVNSLALLAAEAALGDGDFVSRSREANRAGMAQLEAGFAALGLVTIPSVANFVTVDVGRPAGPVYEGLLRQGVIVRPVSNYGLPNHLRVTVGTQMQNRRVLEALGRALDSSGTP